MNVLDTHEIKKKIMVCCDGTGNKFIDRLDPENSNSNVVKLYTTLRIYNDQVGYYHPGVGTGDDPTTSNRISSVLYRAKGLAFAAGFKDNVFDAYRYLMNTYDDGDRVYMIGFSRGAYTVRALAGLLQGYGLLCKGNEGHLEYAWNEYLKQHDNRKETKVKPNDRFKETFSRKKFRIHFLGLWDTVSSVGWINTPLRLFSVAQNPLVRVGRHAISIDERRCFYRDNLWENATADQLAGVASEDDPNPTQDILQVWFPGAHSDVGGSYSQDSSVLSNIALQWLIEQADAAGAEIKNHMKQLVLGEQVSPLPVEHDELARVRALKDLYLAPTKKFMHQSLCGPWWLLEVLPHRYYDKDDGAENWRTPLGMRRRLPSGNTLKPNGQAMQQPTYLHVSVGAMMETGSYLPDNVIGGRQSLMPAVVDGQPEGSLFLYNPPQDPKPMLNRTWVRWAVMIGVSAADIAVVGALAVTGIVAVKAAARALR